MGYQAFNLTTLQLPAPASNMTKAEYKEKYGIDLDHVNIKSFKLVVFGDEKYAITQIKDVEGGIEIYFGGRILSITDIIQTSDVVYDVSNSKPIYCHALQLVSNDTPYLRVTALVFNNSSTPFTFDSFKSWMFSLQERVGENITILASGAFLDTSASSDGNTAIANRIYTQDAKIYISGVSIASAPRVNILDLTTGTLGNFIDGVNKIN